MYPELAARLRAPLVQPLSDSSLTAWAAPHLTPAAGTLPVPRTGTADEKPPAKWGRVGGGGWGAGPHRHPASASGPWDAIWRRTMSW